MKYHSSWSESAIDSFEKAIVAHGGWSAWDKFETVTMKLKKFEGFLPFVKGLTKTFQAPTTIVVNPKTRRVEFDYDTHKDIFLDGNLTFSPEKKVIPDGRTIFKKTTFEKWTPGHSLYFFGYAWANYIGYPFILPQFELIEWQTAETTTSFRIRFPDNFHTHSRVQKFYFNQNHFLSRHDYHADYAGSIFYAAHCTEGYEEKDGLRLSGIRKVRPRVGSIALPFYGIYAELSF
jgi:hypothetical protein